MSKHQAYPEYKDLGVEWLGRGPVSWELAKLKYKTTRVGDGLHSTPKYGEETGFYFVNGNNLVNGKIALTSSAKEVPEDEYLKHLVKLDHKSVLLSINGTIGNVARYNSEPIILGKSAAYINCSCDLLPEFLMYYLQSGEIQRYFDLEVTGTTISNLSLNSIKQLQVCMPNESEQAQIANFLDHETAKIDTLIEKKQQLIKLLKEKRQAVISHTVTKGLNPQAPMKGSGVEWLGKVPEHWIVCRLKNALTIRNGRDYKQVEVESGGYPVYGSGGVFKRSSKYLFDGSSVLFGRKGTIDKPLVVSGKFWTVDTMFYSEINTFHEAKYVYYQASMFPFSLLSTSTALPSMTQEDLLNLGFVSPPLTEQQEIVEYLKIKLDRFEVLISKVEQSIILSKERRIALISAAVTGKIDVRNWEQPND